MSRKHAELERQFIEDLEPRTGRSLGDWMALIDAACLTDKNAIIDWLRPQGLTFAHASWLERIHNNGGRPVYLDAAGRPKAVPPDSAPLPPSPAREPIPAPLSSQTAEHIPPARPTQQPAFRPRSSSAVPGPQDVSLSDLLARGKGLRPLADMLLREIAATLPGATMEPAGELVSIRRPAELAVLLVAPRDLRLGLDLGAHPFDGTLVRARLTGTSPLITHMVVLNDARQVAPALLELVRLADSRVNPSR